MNFVSHTKSVAVPHQIHIYSELRHQIHDDLRIQHPEWVEPNGENPMCDSYQSRLTELLVFQILGVTSVVHAGRPDSTAATSSAGTRKLFIGPSSASVAMGKASLIVSPLTHAFNASFTRQTVDIP